MSFLIFAPCVVTGNASESESASQRSTVIWTVIWTVIGSVSENASDVTSSDAHDARMMSSERTTIGTRNGSKIENVIASF